jgi:hypothetical protein
MNDIEREISMLENRSKEYINVDHVNNKQSEKFKLIATKYRVEILIYVLTFASLLYFKPTVLTKRETIIIKLKQPEADSKGALQTIKKMEVRKIDYGKFFGVWLLISTISAVAYIQYKK